MVRGTDLDGAGCAEAPDAGIGEARAEPRLPGDAETANGRAAPKT